MASEIESSTLVSSIREQLGADKYDALIANSSPSEYLEAGKTLTWDSIRPVLDKLSKIILNTEQQKLYTKGVATTMCSDTTPSTQDTGRTLRALWDQAGWAIVEGVEHFVGVEPQHQQLYDLSHRNGLIVLDSGWTATQLIKYCRAFDNRIVPLCLDESIPVEEKLKAVEQMEVEAILLAGYSQIKNAQFTNVNTVYQTALLGEAKSAASSAGISPETLVQQLLPEVELHSFPLTQATNMPGLLGAHVQIGGLLAVGTVECKLASLVLSAAAHAMGSRREVKATQGQTQGKKPIDIPARIRDVEDYTTTFRKYWRFTTDDARAILSWLKTGAALVDLPPYLWLALNEGSKLYLQMADYLDKYVDLTATEHPESLRQAEDEDPVNAEISKLLRSGFADSLKKYSRA
ncbi:hypothetical protein VHEMI03959 [[Torrubiella] hemipterigena]|uniref:Uncharacterized protein n=1 Tax=[Torrubiella] hemipterigena TaxID=1531966 RepID=A0A0A1STY8_9HYPO|nr:hypothetical protein VHEMI03959 [[Torrubiella] hemipterigena]